MALLAYVNKWNVNIPKTVKPILNLLGVDYSVQMKLPINTYSFAKIKYRIEKITIHGINIHNEHSQFSILKIRVRARYAILLYLLLL